MLSPSMRRVFLILPFEKGPLFASFDCYKPSDAWIVPQVNFKTKANQGFPPSMVGSYGMKFDQTTE